MTQPQPQFQTMLSITTPFHSPPPAYALSTLPIPQISSPSDVLIKVHAASINPVDVKKAAGALKMALADEFPYKIGYDCAGVVAAIGTGVTRVKFGDEVFVRVPEESRGSWSEYVKCADRFVAQKPKSLSFIDAASLPLAGVTALQALRKYRGDLAGKNVLVPAGLSGTGAYACQLAKNVFGAGKVITTVSTAKVEMVSKLLGEGVVDEIIDYTKTDPQIIIPRGTVDFLFDTTGNAMLYLSLMRPRTSIIVSISTLPSGTTLQASNVMKRPDNPQIPLLFRIVLDAGDAIRRLRAWRWGVEYEYFFLQPNGEDLEELGRWVEEGKLRAIVGRVVGLRDIEGVRDACLAVYNGKGGVGKAVIKVLA